MRPSVVKLANGSLVESPYRTSVTGRLPREDAVVQCVVARAANIQGFLPSSRIENPQVTHYEKGQEFKYHFDWSADSAGRINNREATIFGILDVDCRNCGTHFPHLAWDWTTKDPSWCTFFECGNTTLLSRPVAGSALYWRNMHANGTGDERTLHAGLPIPDGFKTGVNIWTRVDS